MMKPARQHYVAKRYEPQVRKPNMIKESVARGFVDVPVHAGHPKRVLHEPAKIIPTEISLMKLRIRNAKVAARRSARHAAGRHLSSDAGIKQMKRELRTLRNGKRRK